jgi:hypothetical protein
MHKLVTALLQCPAQHQACQAVLLRVEATEIQCMHMFRAEVCCVMLCCAMLCRWSTRLVCWTVPSTPHSPGCSQQEQTGTCCCGATDGWVELLTRALVAAGATLAIHLLACVVGVVDCALVLTVICCCGATEGWVELLTSMFVAAGATLAIHLLACVGAVVCVLLQMRSCCCVPTKYPAAEWHSQVLLHS